MTTAADIRAQIDKLRASLGSVASTAFDGRSVSYKDNAEVLAAIEALETDLQRIEGTGPPRNVVVRSHKGW